ncbi:MAG: FlxA-like family protein [Calditrichia bacterium]
MFKYHNGTKLFTISIFLLAALFLLPVASMAGDNATHVGGYGELHYNKPMKGVDKSKSAGKLDFHRFVLFFGHQFNNWVSFHSELEVEHTYVEGGEKTGEVALEQAYVELQYSPKFALRAGVLLVPVGIINPYHEPPTFNGVERPNVEKYIIPSTWRESGIGATGKLNEKFSYEAYLMAGLNPEGITGKDGIRGARQKAYNASTDDYAFTARLNYQHNLNLSTGASFFTSSLSRDAKYGNALEGARLTMGEIHAIANFGNFQARALAVVSSINEAAKLNQLFSATDADNPMIGDGQFGAYGELAYDFLGHILPETEQRLFAFARYETYNTHNSTDGFDANPEYERKETTLGLTYLPTTRVALKADIQLLKTAGEKDVTQFNMGVGYNF